MTCEQQRVFDGNLVDKKISRRWSGKDVESAAAESSNGFSSRLDYSRSRSARICSLQGDILRALEAREQNRIVGRQVDIFKALEARKKNRQRAEVSKSGPLERGADAAGVVSPVTSAQIQVSSGDGVEVNGGTRSGPLERGPDAERKGGGRGEIADVSASASARSQVSSGNGVKVNGGIKNLSGSSISSAVQDATQHKAEMTVSVAGPKLPRKSNLKTTLQPSPSLQEEKKAKLRGRVLILTAAVAEVGVSTQQQGEEVARRVSRSREDVKDPPVAAPELCVDKPRVRFEEPVVKECRRGVTDTHEHNGGVEAPTVKDVGSVDVAEEKGGMMMSEDAELLAGVGAGTSMQQQGDELIRRESSGSGVDAVVVAPELSADGVRVRSNDPVVIADVPSVEVMDVSSEKTEAEEKDGTRRPRVEDDSEMLGADLEARLLLLKKHDWSSSSLSTTPTIAMSLSDQVKALRSGSTRPLVARLTSSASHSVPHSSGSPGLRTPAPRRPSSSQPRQKTATKPATPGYPSAQMQFDSVMDEVWLPEEDLHQQAEAMKDSIHGPTIWKHFSLKALDKEFRHVSRKQESLELEAQKLVEWAKASSSALDFTDEEEEQGSDLHKCNTAAAKKAVLRNRHSLVTDSECRPNLVMQKRRKVKQRSKRWHFI